MMEMTAAMRKVEMTEVRRRRRLPSMREARAATPRRTISAADSLAPLLPELLTLPLPVKRCSAAAEVGAAAADSPWPLLL